MSFPTIPNTNQYLGVETPEIDLSFKIGSYCGLQHSKVKNLLKIFDSIKGIEGRNF
jgi:hypothetical protein